MMGWDGWDGVDGMGWDEMMGYCLYFAFWSIGLEKQSKCLFKLFWCVLGLLLFFEQTCVRNHISSLEVCWREHTFL